MYPPKEKGEIVKTTEGIGEWTGKKGSYGEHYEIRLFRPNNKTISLHYESIEKIGDELREKLLKRLKKEASKKKLEEV